MGIRATAVIPSVRVVMFRVTFLHIYFIIIVFRYGFLEMRFLYVGFCKSKLCGIK